MERGGGSSDTCGIGIGLVLKGCPCVNTMVLPNVKCSHYFVFANTEFITHLRLGKWVAE